MASACYQLAIIPYTEFLQNIASILENKFGSGIVLYTSDSSVIFSPPAAISDKVFRIYRNRTDYNCVIYMGDSWTSGTTITNSVIIISYSVSQTHRSAILTLSDSFMLLNIAASNSQQLLIGQLDNEDYVALGFGAAGASFKTSTRQPIMPIMFSAPFVSAAGHAYRQPSMFAIVGGELLTIDGVTPATIPGLYNISHGASDGPIYDAGKFISLSGLATNAATFLTSYLVYL